MRCYFSPQFHHPSSLCLVPEDPSVDWGDSVTETAVVYFEVRSLFLCAKRFTILDLGLFGGTRLLCILWHTCPVVHRHLPRS